MLRKGTGCSDFGTFTSECELGRRARAAEKIEGVLCHLLSLHGPSYTIP